MRKFNHKDYINISILVITFLLIIFSIVGFDHVNGSEIDWSSQHWILPEYFRNLFYKTGDLFPSFAFNIGGGQNIYNLSYYGLLNPIILISYLIPSVLMVNYIEVSIIVVVIASVILMYYWLHRRFDSKYAFIGTLLFLLAAPITYHTHRHIMFINYFPFLIMGLIGVDKYFEKNKKILLILSVFLIIMTSYYYSVGGILTLILYGIYKYIETKDKITFKSFMKDGLKYVLYIIVGILMSSVLLFPTFYALLNGRADITQTFNVFELLIPAINLDQVLYTAYTLGVTSVLILGIVFGIFSSKKQNNYLSIVFILIIIFPIITYLLSGFMYFRGKVLIPLLPLAILLITNMFDDITVKKNVKFTSLFIILSIIQIIHYIFVKQYVFILDVVILLAAYLIYKKHGNKSILIIPVCTCAFLCCLVNNYTDKLVTKEEISNQYDVSEYTKLNKLIVEDENIYRVGNDTFGLSSLNRIVDTDYYVPSIYSSINNIDYYNFVNNIIGSEMEGRISTAIYPSKNILFNTYMGTKYFITKGNVPIGYENIENSNVYVNENVLPIGYSTSHVISKKEYDTLSYPDNIYAIISNIVVDKDVESNYESKIREENLKYEVTTNTTEIKEENEQYIVKSDKDGKLVLDLNKSFNNKMLFISFDMNYEETCLTGDTHITINGVENTLSCKEWSYPNKNHKFTYVISANNSIDELNIEFTKGTYKISNIKTYSLDYDYILDSVDKVDEFKINKELTVGDKIAGDINVTENGYFMITVPYDKGFNVYLDGNLINYEKVDNSFIGFEINEGHHDIEIIYIAPYLLEGMITSIVGYMIFLPIIYSDLRKRNKKKK